MFECIKTFVGLSSRMHTNLKHFGMAAAAVFLFTNNNALFLVNFSVLDRFNKSAVL